MADAEWKTNDLENAEFRGWTECAKAMRQYDEGMIKGWKEEIDTLLVFAGLFSAVLTAFSLESYQLLQPDPQETTVHLLTLLTQSSLSNITIPSPLIPAFKPPSSAVRINTFWFASLVCALLSALLGILVKQWLREYLSTGLTAPRDFVRLRHFRFAGLGAWRVPDIVAVLPLLLQIALVLFFGGLLDLLWTLHPVVAGITTALVALSLSLVSATVIAPFFSPTCPYRSPFALHLARVLKPSTSPHSRTDIPATWFDRDLIHTSSSPSPRKTSDLDQPALSWAFAHLRSDSLLDLLAPCAKALRPRARATLILHDLASHAAFAPHVLLRALRQGPYAAVDALYDKLVPGHRGAARTLALVLDLLPELPTRDSLSRLSRTTTAEPMSKDIPNRQDLLTLLHPLLGAFIASGAQRYGTRAHLIQKTLGVLVSLGTYDGEPGSSVDMAWRTIVVFSHLFWKHVTLADVETMVAVALRDPGARNEPRPHLSVVSAATAALHFLPALSAIERSSPTMASSVHELLGVMEAHVRSCNLVGRPYAGGRDNVGWCWELCRVAQSEHTGREEETKGAGMVQVGMEMVEALEEAVRKGLVANSEISAVRRLRYLLDGKQQMRGRAEQVQESSRDSLNAHI